MNSLKAGVPETVRVCQGIGGTLDTVVGKVRRAPRIFRRLGLEWFYRLLRGPRGVRRQKVLPLFVARLVGEKVRQVLGRRPRPDQAS